MSKGGIADRMIAFNGFPFLDNKEDPSFGVPVSQAMTSNPTCFPATGLEFRDVHRILSENKFQGYPIVDDLSSRTLLGYIGRTELLYAINRVERDQKIAVKAKIYFTPSNSRNMGSPALGRGPAVTFDTMAATAGQMSVDFSRYIDSTPLSVHPRLPLETVMELFKKMGPRVILIEHRGKLTGLVTVKDCLKYQFKVEAHENPKDDDTALEERQERLWHLFQRVGSWFSGKRPSWTGGVLRLGDDSVRNSVHTPPDEHSLPGRSHERQGSGDSRDTDLELEDR
jgi:chloride channel 3/4/5